MIPEKSSHWRTQPALCVLALGCLPLLHAQSTGPSTGPSTDDLQKQVQNPVSSLISVPFQNNTNFPMGTGSRIQDVLNVQPVVPIGLSENWNLIVRWITPIVYQPVPNASDGSATGLGDMNPTFFLSPAKPGKVIWGFGPAFLLPTATDSTLGQGKWAAGPSIVILAQPKPWTIGFFANNVWSFAGNRFRRPVNQFYTQYFWNYNMKNGWYTGTSPIVTCNWNASGPNRWTVPFGWFVGKIVRAGTLPLNMQLGTYYNLMHPRDLPYGKWQVRAQVAMLFPKAK
jgi:hypothetical protein